MTHVLLREPERKKPIENLQIRPTEREEGRVVIPGLDASEQGLMKIFLSYCPKASDLFSSQIEKQHFPILLLIVVSFHSGPFL